MSALVDAQNPWLDSMRNAVAIGKEDTNKVNMLIGLSEGYKFNYPDTGFYYAQQALKLAEKLKFETGIFWAIVAIDKSLYSLGNYALELDYALRAYPLGKKINQPYTIGWANGTLGDCYFNLGDYHSALKYYREVIRLATEKSLIDLSSIYSATVPVLVKLQLYDSALIYAKKGYDLYKINPILNNQNSEDGKYSSCFIYRFLGEAHAGKKNYDSALHYFRLSLSYAKILDLQLNEVDLFNNMATAFQHKEMYDSAIYYGKLAIEQRMSKKYPAAVLTTATILSDIYAIQQQPDSTLKYLRIAFNLKDSLFNQEKLMAFKNILFKEQEKQNEVKAARIEVQSRYNIYGLIALFIVLAIIATIIVRNRRIKQLQNIRNSIADDLHDDIGSTLSSIAIMNELAKEKSPAALPLLNSIGESTAVIQENMSDIVWAVNPANDSFENLLQRMQIFATEITEAKNINLVFSSDPVLSASRLTMKQRKNIYLFFKESVNNAVKHSGAENLKVTLLKKDSSVEITVTDDGNGFDVSEIYDGNGMSSLKKRAEELQGTFGIDSRDHEGTSVYLKLRIT